jgi:hypothetical protein
MLLFMDKELKLDPEENVREYPRVLYFRPTNIFPVISLVSS